MIDLAMLKASASCLRLAIDVAAQLSGPSQSPEAWSDVIADQLQHLGSLIRDRSDKILSNLENAKMQELTSRINIIAILIKSGDTDHIMPSVISLCEALDYAKMRLFEGNMEWFFPFYVGHTVAVTALRCLDKSDGAFESSLRSSFKQGRSAVCLALENIARQNIKKPAVFGKLFDNFKAGDDLALVSLLENLENIRGRLTGARERWQQSLDMDGCGLGLFFHADNPSLFFTYEGFPDYYEFQNCRMFNSDKFEKIKNIEFTEDYEGKTNLPDKYYIFKPSDGIKLTKVIDGEAVKVYNYRFPRENQDKLMGFEDDAAASTVLELAAFTQHQENAKCIRIVDLKDKRTVTTIPNANYDLMFLDGSQNYKKYNGNMCERLIIFDYLNLLAVIENRYIALFHLQSGELANRIVLSSSCVWCWCHSPIKTLIATGAYGGDITVFDIARGLAIARMQAHRSPIRSLAFSPGADFLVSASYDGTVIFWEISTGEKISAISVAQGFYQGPIAVSSSGHRVITTYFNIPFWGKHITRIVAWDTLYQ